jgi:hypothetical protein
MAEFGKISASGIRILYIKAVALVVLDIIITRYY